ncbi:MAG: hypothetical protein KF684_05065 [Phycisphaeraceae bacterium]|nr:hypothetical protein [Phycisphaeraceae bacterium]
MRTAHSVALTCTAVVTAAAHAGTPTVARWAAPVGGAFVDPNRWVGNLLPNSMTPALIDAVGAPYTIQNVGLTMPVIPLLTLNSADATLRIGGSSFLPNFSWATGDIDVRAGVLEFSSTTLHSAPDRSLLIGERGTLRIPTNGMSGFSANRLTIRNGMSLFSNEGLVELGRNTELVALRNFITSQTTTLTNAHTGRIHADAAAGIYAGTIINEGAMVFTERPDSSFPNQPVTVIEGESIASDVPRTGFHHSGSITLHDAAVEIVGSSESAGLFTIDATSSLTLTTRTSSSNVLGYIRLNPGTRFEGGGTVTIQSNDITGDILADNDLRIHGTHVGSIVNAGTTTLRGFSGSGPTQSQLATLASGGRLSLVLNSSGITIQDDFAPTGGLEILLAGVTTSTSINVGGNTHLGGAIDLSATSLTTGADLTIAPAASVNSTRDITVGGNLNSNALDNSVAFIVSGDAQVDGSARVRQWRVDGLTTVSGNLTTTQGTTTLNDGSAIGGTLTASSTSIQGSVAIGSFTTAPSTTITLDGELTLTADTSLTTSRIILAPLPGSSTDFTSRIHADVTLTRPANQVVPSFQSSVLFASDLARTLEVEGQMSLAGRLALTYFNLSDAAFGQSFTLIHATEGLTGQFDPLSLPTLAGGLSLELVYDAHSLTLRVIPAPGPAALLALTGIAATRRRRA